MSGLRFAGRCSRGKKEIDVVSEHATYAEGSLKPCSDALV